MKPILKILAVLTLLLAPLAAGRGASSPHSRIIIASEAGAKLDSDLTKGGGTDDTALIQGILDTAPKLSSLKLIVDGAGGRKPSKASSASRRSIGSISRTSPPTGSRASSSTPSETSANSSSTT